MFIGIGIGVTAQLHGGIPTVPATVTDLRATAASDTEVLLEFTPAGGASSYQYRVDGGSWVTTSDNSGTQLVTGLTAATEYDFEVRGVNVIGNGAASNVATVTTNASAVDTTAPVLSLPTAFQTGPTAATVGATTDEGNGTLYYVVTTSATAPTKAQVKAGQDNAGSAAAASGSQAISGTGAKTFSATGLSASTAYYTHLMHEDAAANQSTVISSAQFTTAAAPDVTAPTLSSPTDIQTGTTTATLTVSTNEANGTLYWFASTSATPPSGANLKAGTGAVQFGTQAITTTGVKTVNVTGLTAGTAYYSYFLHRDAAGNDSTISSADGFTTTALGAGVLDTSITAPVLTLAVGATTYPPQFDAALDTTVAVGDTIELQWDDDIRFGSVTSTATNVIDPAEASAFAATFTGLSSISSGTNYFRARVVQATTNNYSNWSAIIMHGAVADVTPSAFSFTDITAATLSTQYVSNEITLAGFNQPVAISVTGGEYAVDAGSGYGAYTSSAGTAYPGDKVKVRHTSSGTELTATNTVLTVGGVSDTYTTTTLDVDEQPDAFAFTDQTGATTSTDYTSNTITIAGLGSGVSVPVTITGGTYSKNAGGFTSSAGTAVNGDTFAVKGTASASAATSVNVVLTVGETSDTYTITTTSTYETEADALFARFGTDPGSTRKGQMNTLIAAMKTAGVWAKLDAFYVLAAHAEADARLNWKSSNFNLTASASAPTFTTDRGTAGSSTPRYFDTGFNPTTASSPNFVQNSGCIGAVSATDTQSDALFDVCNDSFNILLIANGSTGDTPRVRINATSSFSPGAFGSGIGHFTASRTSSSLTTVYANGSSIGTNSVASAAPLNETIKIHGRTGNYSTRQLRMVWIGSGLSGAEEAAFQTAREAYLDAIGAGVV